MIDLDDFWYIVRSQHYTKREMEIIYGNLEYVPPKLRNMMMMDIFARRNSINKNKLLQKNLWQLILFRIVLILTYQYRLLISVCTNP